MAEESANTNSPVHHPLNDTVIQGGYCIGCGTCAAIKNSAYNIGMNAKGQYQARLKDSTGDVAPTEERVCPFSEQALDEDEIGRRLYSTRAMYDKHIGYYLSTYAGYVSEGDFRARGSSGGFGKWILYELLNRDLVDAVIQVAATEPQSHESVIYQYTVMHEKHEVLEGSKSVYYPVEMSEVLSYVRNQPGRYAITGIPCFIKALRLLCLQDEVFRERIRFCIGLICGHLKSKRYADMLAWQMGVEPGQLTWIDFRKKLPDTFAYQKGVEVKSVEPNAKVRDPDIVQNLYGTKYPHGFFQYEACNFCDDVVGETADVSVGDAWLKEYVKDGEGTSIIVVRHPQIQQLVDEAIEEGRLALEPVGVDKVVESQAGGFRQRREGLAYRLYLTEKQGKWHPPSRVDANARHISRKRKKIYELRMAMAERSHGAFARALEQGDFQVFVDEMTPLQERYIELYHLTLQQRIKRRIKRWIQTISPRLWRFLNAIRTSLFHFS